MTFTRPGGNAWRSFAALWLCRSRERRTGAAGCKSWWAPWSCLAQTTAPGLAVLSSVDAHRSSVGGPISYTGTPEAPPGVPFSHQPKPALPKNIHFRDFESPILNSHTPMKTTIRHFLALFAPRATLTLARRSPRLGESVDLSWAFSGRFRRIEKLRLYLEGREEATYRRGTSTATDRSVFAEVEIATATDPGVFGGGHAMLTVPADAVPTLAGSNNRIVWTLRVKGVIRLYPDVDDTFEIPVLPRAICKGGEKV